MKTILLTAAIVLVSQGAIGKSSEMGLIKAGAKKAGVSLAIYYSLLLQESGRNGKPWKWTLNHNGKGMYFDSRNEARKYLSEAIEKGDKNIDVGLSQINIRWNGELVKNPLNLLEPKINIAVSAKILKDCMNRFSELRKGLSCYHAGRVVKHGMKYAEKVIKRAEKYGHVSSDTNYNQSVGKFLIKQSESNETNKSESVGWKVAIL